GVRRRPRSSARQKGGRFGGGQAALEAGDGAAQDTQGAGEAEAVGGDAGGGGGLGHRQAGGGGGQQKAGDLPDDPRRARGADRRGWPAVGLVGLQLVGRGLGLPALVVLGGQRGGGVERRVQQRGEDAVALAVAGAGRVVDGVLDDPDAEAVLPAAAR